VTEPARAVFLSYASQDADSARRIAAALREGGIEVWLDQSELRGGEAWDASIRRQIKTCKLFLAVISANTQAREEGYFRREWNLAVGRTLDMAEDTPFLLPVVIDAIRDTEARVPEKFREVQWTRLPAGETPASFVERVRGLTATRPPAPVAVSPLAAPEPRPAVRDSAAPAPAAARQKSDRANGSRILRVAIPALLLAVAAATLIPPWQKKEHARNVLLPEIENAAAKMFRSNRQVFDQAMEAARYLPGDPTLTKLLPSIVNTVSVDTEPAGAEVFWKDYDTPGAGWRSAGVTPLKDAKVPRDFLRLEIRKRGMLTIEVAVPMFALRIPPIKLHLKMDPLGSLPPDMARIPSSTTDMQVVGIEKSGPKDVPEFLMDKFEVTNRQFKAFVDAGGYTNPAYWTVPIREGDQVLRCKRPCINLRTAPIVPDLPPGKPAPFRMARRINP